MIDIHVVYNEKHMILFWPSGLVKTFSEELPLGLESCIDGVFCVVHLDPLNSRAW